jgi:hypothetical protein
MICVQGKLKAQTSDLTRSVALAEAQERTLKTNMSTAESNIRGFKEQVQRMKSTVSKFARNAPTIFANATWKCKSSKHTWLIDSEGSEKAWVLQLSTSTLRQTGRASPLVEVTDLMIPDIA